MGYGIKSAAEKVIRGRMGCGAGSGNDINAGRDAVMAPALKKCDVPSARIYALSEVGLMDLGPLSQV